MSRISLAVGLSISFCLLGVNVALRHSQRADDLLVNTNYGYVLGSLEYSRNSREYASFRGIPYAQPPVGELRFKSPLPPQLWNSPYNATVDAPICLQAASSLAEETIFLGQEDCLYLNVYVPIIQNASNELLPVMAFIPGGGMLSGGSPSNMYGPRYLMDKDVILVTFNYRVGPLGFVTTLDDAAPGNFGLKDQVMALRFVNENIEGFGGDKNRVTLFGESSGGQSVGYQLVSPLSNGLFQQAIGQSGTALDGWTPDINEQQLKVTNTVAELVGCSDFIGDSQNLIGCFRSLDAETLVGTVSNLIPVFMVPYSVVTEARTDLNPLPFLEKSPSDYIESGDFKQIPYIIGTNKDEGILYAGMLLKANDTREQFNNNFDSMLPSMLRIKPGHGGDIVEVVNNLTDFYLGGDHFVNVSDPTKIQRFIDMFTDRNWVYSADRIILSLYLQGQESIWVYNFGYRGNYSTGERTGSSDINFNWGVSHGDDMQFLFESPDYVAPYGLDGFDVRVSEDMVTLWTNFAIFGNPDPHENYSWSKLHFDSGVSNENLNYLNISGSYDKESMAYQLEEGYFLERMRFWSELDIQENS